MKVDFVLGNAAADVQRRPTIHFGLFSQARNRPFYM